MLKEELFGFNCLVFEEELYGGRGLEDEVKLEKRVEAKLKFLLFNRFLLGSCSVIEL